MSTTVVPEEQPKLLDTIGARIIKRLYRLPLIGRWMLTEREELVRAGERLKEREFGARLDEAGQVAAQRERARCLDILTREYKTRREKRDNPRATTVLGRLFKEVLHGEGVEHRGA